MADRLDYAVLIAFATREEADVAACALRADGIDAFVGNEHHAALEWGLVPALGGMQVMVPSRLLADAKKALRERLLAASEDDEDSEPASRRDRYKAWLALGWLGLGFLVFGVNVIDRVTLRATDDYRQEQRAFSEALRQICASRDVVLAGDDLCADLRAR